MSRTDNFHRMDNGGGVIAATKLTADWMTRVRVLRGERNSGFTLEMTSPLKIMVLVRYTKGIYHRNLGREMESCDIY